MWDGWDFAILVLTGMLTFGVVERANDPLDLGEVGWTPPAVLDRREKAAPAVPDWPSPARLRRAAGVTAEARPSDQTSIRR